VSQQRLDVGEKQTSSPSGVHRIAFFVVTLQQLKGIKLVVPFLVVRDIRLKKKRVEEGNRILVYALLRCDVAYLVEHDIVYIVPFLIHVRLIAILVFSHRSLEPKSSITFFWRSAGACGSTAARPFLMILIFFFCV